MKLYVLIILASFCVLFPGAALAYVGPGIGVALVSYVFGPIAAIIAGIAALLYFPARWYWKKLKNKQNNNHSSSANKENKK